jgi:lipopolysaccharide export system protein LptC
VIFNAKTEQYAIHAQNGVITNKGLQTLYEKFVKNSDPTIQPTKNQNGGFLFKDYQQFRMIAQQTTGGEVRQLYFEVILDL